MLRHTTHLPTHLTQHTHTHTSKMTRHLVVAACMCFTVAILFNAAAACNTDDDCRPSSCCHSTMCVDTTKAPAPNCSDVLCTVGCHHNTLDCGGDCRCSPRSHTCKPFIRAGMPPEGAGPWMVNPSQPAPQTQQTTRIVHVKRVVFSKPK